MIDLSASAPCPLSEFAASRICSQRGVVDLTLPQEQDETLEVPDVVVSEWQSTVPCPSVDASLLKVTMPTADNCLAVKQAAIDDWEKKLVAKHTALQDIIKEHDEKYNPSGRTHKTTAAGDASSSAGGASNPPGLQSLASEDVIDWPAEQTYDSMDALKKEGTMEAMAGLPAEYTLHSTGNKVFVQAHEDYILDTSVPLCHVWGKYHTGSEVKQAKDKKASLVPLEVTSADFVAYWSGHSAWPAFTTSPCPLSDFADYMETHGVTDFTFACHDVQFGTEEDLEGPMTIKSKEKCAFEPLPFPSSARGPQHVNFGSKIPKTKVDWSTGDVSGGLCHMKFHFKYDDSTQVRGITPQKPAIFIKKPLRMKKGKAYALVF